MITNERQRFITEAAVKKFEKTIVAAEKKGPSPGVHTRAHEAAIASMREQVKELRRELEAFDGLSAARGKKRFAGRLDDMTLLLTQCRAARGWTQAELAEKLGVKMQQVQRDEAGGYARASLDRVQFVLQTCGALVDVEIRLIALPKNLGELLAKKPRALVGRS